MAEDRFYNHRAAAAYLGVHPRTLEQRVVRGLITPMRMTNNDRLYTQDQLDSHKKEMEKKESEYTLQEIADKFEIDYHRVYRAFRMRRHVVPERTIGKVPLFNQEQVDLIAKQEGWEKEAVSA